jgi:hypothetical protein
MIFLLEKKVMFIVKKPKIIAHRGASALAPENTLAAFRRAIADGAEGIEFDVRSDERRCSGRHSRRGFKARRREKRL